MTKGCLARSLVVPAIGLVLLIMPATVFGHCDGMDGPVVKAAQKALETGNVNHVLIWVRKNEEAEIRGTFEKTLAVRKLSPGARELADLHFFETLVRIHRAGEGEPYTGLKPAGRDLGPAIPSADKAIGAGSAGPLLDLLTRNARAGVQERFRHVLATKDFGPSDVEAGREYVKAYVEFLHYVEGLHEASTRPSQGHSQESKESETQKHRH